MNVRLSATTFLLLLPLMAFGQTFKGHHIGESVADFLKAEPSLVALEA